MKNKTKSTTEFYDALEQFDMTINSGLVFVSDKENVSSEERIALEIAEKYQVTAVYFRRFPNGRVSIPQVYIYDYTSVSLGQKEKQELSELHKTLWNTALVPLFFAFFRSEVVIFNCHNHPEIDTETGKIRFSVLRQIQLAATAEKEINEFSGKLFDNGLFWESPNFKDEFRLDQSVYEKLLTELKRAKMEIVRRNILPKKVTQKLLVMTILIKYLEERRDEEGLTVFPRGFFSKFAENSESFADVLRNTGACLKLFDFLSEHFNGKIFEWKEPAEREQLSKVDLSYFADFLEGRIDGRQYVLWPLYSFNHLPIELISNIYEDFLEDKPGVVYTPPYLVDFLVNEVLPLSDKDHDNIRIIDPACGSGIFLVSAYRRLVDRWRLHNNWEKADLTTLQQIMKNQIYGVDIDQEAVRLTAFSLSLTLCDMLSPKVIWEELKFDNLFERNLISNDYFDLLENDFFEDKFDIVIGNPPFNSNFTTISAKQIELLRQIERPAIPDTQLALLFLDQSFSICKDGGIVCLILPAGPMLYNNTSFEFRKHILTTYNVLQFIDFSALNNVLFQNANVSATAVFVKNETPFLEHLLHVTVRRTKAAKERLYFEIDHYDLHKIVYKEAIENPMIWKANLLGGGRIKYLVERLSQQRTFGEYLKQKVKFSGWKVGEGYHPIKAEEKEKLLKYMANFEELNEKELNELEKIRKKNKKAEFLTNKPSIATEGLTENGLDIERIFIEKEELFERRRVEELFKGPHVLIRELAGKNTIPVVFYKHDLSFTGQIFGIHGPESDVIELKKIEERIKNNKLYLFYLAACSGRYMISKQSSVLKRDIEKLPYPEDEEQIKLSRTEEILVDDVLKYGLSFHRKGEYSEVYNEVNAEALNKYGKIYCEVLNPVYKNLKALEPIQTTSFICFPFYFEEKPLINLSDENVEHYLNELLIKENVSSNLRIMRILRIYHENIIYQIKPKMLKFWLPSIAIRDADETFYQLLDQGY